MKKFQKSVIAVACAGVLCAGVAAVAGCNSDKTGEAWALTHGAGYVGYASITVNGDKVKDATLTEVCLPTHVEAGETVPEADKVTVKVMSHGKEVEATYYKTVSYGSVTLTYDAEAKTYKSGTTALLDLFKDEAACKAYYEAVITNQVSVTVGSEKKTDVLNKKSLSKEDNGYWTKEDDNGNKYSQWKVNRDATVKYVKDNGVANLLKLARNDETKLWMDGTISTGATWSDLNSDTTGKGYLSYAQLIVKANDAANK